MKDSEPKSLRRARAFRKQLTDAETILRSRLRRKGVLGLHFRKQHPIGPYIADFACSSARLVVEVDGDTHATHAELEHDRKRDAYLAAHGWRILRVTNEDVYKRLEDVLEGITRQIG